MICDACKDRDHAHCIDIYWGPDLDTGQKSPMVIEIDGSTEADDWYLKPGRLYRSCDCLHKVTHQIKKPLATTGADE